MKLKLLTLEWNFESSIFLLKSMCSRGGPKMQTHMVALRGQNFDIFFSLFCTKHLLCILDEKFGGGLTEMAYKILKKILKMVFGKNAKKCFCHNFTGSS